MTKLSETTIIKKLIIKGDDMNKITLTLLVSFTLFIGCVTTQKKEQSIVGTWKMVGVECDSEGNNCRVSKSLLLSYKSDGFLYAGTKKYAPYKVEKNSFVISEAYGKKTRIFFKIKNNIMITHEENSKNHEKLLRQ